MNDFKLPDDVVEIFTNLRVNDFNAYVVGGCVRDMILGRKPKDWDICTDATPEQIIDTLPCYKIIPTGIKHGTVTLIVHGTPYEVTTFRTDGNYSDNRHPDSVTFSSDIVEDLKRRDFTMNAIAYNPYTDGFIDPFNGRCDIMNNLIKCVGNPDDRFQEDALRMMRAIRFCSQLSFVIDMDTWQSIARNAKLIQNVSKERIRDEIDKILLSDFPEGIRSMYMSGLLDYIIPELSECFKTKQNNPHHIYDVGEHTIVALEHSIKDLDIRLAVMLHDIGKPVTKSTDEEGIDHFYKHEDVSASLARKILTDLRYDNETIDKVVILISHHMDYLVADKRIVRRFLNRVGEENFFNILFLRSADISAQSIEKLEWESEVIEIVNIVTDIKSDKECFSTKTLAIDGNDLISIGFKQGKQLGDTLKTLLDEVLEDASLNEREKLLTLAESMRM